MTDQNREEQIGFRIDEDAKRDLQAIANKYQRTLSDRVRHLIQMDIKQHRRYLGRLK